MKNRSYRLSAFLLAVIMVIGILPAVAIADGSYVGPVAKNYTYTVQDAGFSFASDGKTVNNVADLNPNKVSTMTVTVPDSAGLPQNSDGTILVKVPDYVKVTAENASACNSSEVSCTYRSDNMLAFKWIGPARNGFTVELEIIPNAPATKQDVSGNKVLVVRNANTNVGPQPIVTQSTQKKIDGIDRLTGVVGQLYNNRITAVGKEITVWKIQRISGDWYSISSNGKYLKYGENGNNISLVENPYYFLYDVESNGPQFIGFSAKGEKYYLNNKQNNVDKGLQASTYNDQHIELYTKLETSGNEAFVSYSANGGSTKELPASILVQKGDSITLPEYKGTKNGNVFMGWALISNVKTNVYNRIYQPGETLTIEKSITTIYAVWSPANPEKAQFGIRLDGSIPDEPAQYDTSSYSKEHIYKDAVVKNAIWIIATDAAGKTIDGNHLVNAVTENLKSLPTDAEIKTMVPDYDPETMYVHWYVMKWASNSWHVDGVIARRNQEARIRYSANVSDEEKTGIKNIPAAYGANNGTEIRIGADATGKQMKEPVYPDHVFQGWTMTEDGSGTVFRNEEVYQVEGNVTFYAQWREIPKYTVSYELTDAPDGIVIPETLRYEKDETVTLAAAAERDGYLFSGWMINGEKLEGSSFIMPDENVTIQGIYYGPISVQIQADWAEREMGYYGAIVNLTAVLSGADGLDCTLQWQYRENGEWVNWKTPTLDRTTSYELNEETSARMWRVIVTDARPHQE